MMFKASVLVIAALALAGCVNASPPSQPQAANTATGYPPGVTPSRFKLPEGEGCKGETARFQAVMDNDLATGHVNKSVYDKVSSEIASAAFACQSGQDGQAIAMIRATKTRYGYP